MLNWLEAMIWRYLRPFWIRPQGRKDSGFVTRLTTASECCVSGLMLWVYTDMGNTSNPLLSYLLMSIFLGRLPSQLKMTSRGMIVPVGASLLNTGWLGSGKAFVILTLGTIGLPVSTPGIKMVKRSSAPFWSICAFAKVWTILKCSFSQSDAAIPQS